MLVVVGFPGCCKYCSPRGFGDVPLVIMVLLLLVTALTVPVQLTVSSLGYVLLSWVFRA